MADTTPSPPSGRGRSADAAAVQGERRIITALFCDVVNSTSLAEQLDPEDWTDLLNEAFHHLTAPIVRYEGTVAKLLGDGVLAFFGAPVSHEDDPHRAVLAALDMIEASHVVRERVKAERGLEFDVRIGINTGPVVVSDVGADRGVDALGDAVNVAARMEQAAAPGTILLSGDTYRLVAPLFDVESLGEIELKGKAERMPAYRVIGPKAEPGRVRGIEGVSAPLIGRDREFAQLRAAMNNVRAGRGQIVGLIGEAGLGKSRMLTELKKEWDETEETDWIVMTGIPYDTGRPYGLFQNFAREMFEVNFDDPVDVIHEKIVKRLRSFGKDEETVALCSVAFERVIAAKTLLDGSEYTAEVVKKDIYDTMRPSFERHARRVPSVLVVDDLHWADPASVDLLVHLLQLADEVALLIIFALRPERQSPAWRVKQKAETDLPHRYTELNLRPLDAAGTDALVSALLSIANLPVELRQLILRKTDGNPYFVEEIVRTLIDEGVVAQTGDGLRWEAKAKVSEIAIPDTLQALLMARIDRLDQETRSTLQMASVIGRSFYYSILKRISDSALALDKQLRSLERVELLLESARSPELEYMFKHELARDAAYGSLLNRKRRDFHRRVGEAIETIFVGRIEEYAHLLAQHFELAGDSAKAQRYYEMSAESALSMHATDEGAAHFGRALDCAKSAGAPASELQRLEARRLAVQGA